MMKLLNMLMFGNSFFKEYPAISLDKDAIGEKVLFEFDGRQTDVSQRQWLLSLEPMVFGIWFEGGFTIGKSDKAKLLYHTGHAQAIVVSHLVFIQSLDESEGSLLLFEVKNSEILHLNRFRAKLIYHFYYKRPNLSFDQFRNLAAAFSYPRKVRLISFRKGDYFNIFPMDLVGRIPGTDRFVFGLRHSNNTLDKIIENKKIVSAEFPSSLKQEAYQLSKHHAGNPPGADSLPFKVTMTQLYGFPIAESTLDYNEIEILKTVNLGSHMLLWGVTRNAVTVNEEQNGLYHIHFIHFLHQRSGHAQYQLVK